MNFPKWTTLTEAEDLAEAIPMTPEQLGTDPGSQAVIKEAGKAVEITDKARLVAFGDPFSETQRQLGVLIAPVPAKNTAEIPARDDGHAMGTQGGAKIIEFRPRKVTT